ncbi:MAG: lprG [Mycobacterium sp.]|jgi:lipoprotein LprG|nr:lprG [Mycobacterium sp.]
MQRTGAAPGCGCESPVGTLYDADMQTRRRLIAVLAALSTAAVVVAGCSSSSGGSSQSLPDAATLLTESSQTTKSLQSVHLNLTVDGKIEGLPVKTLDADLTNAPETAAQGKAKITMGGSDIDVDLVVYNKILYGALTPNNWIDFGPAADIYDPSLILNPDTGLANLLANFTDAKSEATETVNGVQTVRVTGKVSADAVNKLAPQIAAKGPVPGTAWIRQDGNHELMRAKLEPSQGTSVQMTLSDWGKTVAVTKPPV